MKKKICLWINNNFVMLGVGKYLQENFDYEIYAIVDSNSGIDEVIEKQQIVKFKKIWYFGKNVVPKKNIEVEYLKNAEKKYDLKMMFVASTERLFYKKFNKYYDFKHNEILSILEQETKIFENILNEVKLDYILCTPIVRHYQYLFYLICKTQSTKFLMFEPIRFGDRYMISEELFLNAAKTIDFRQIQFQEKTKDEIINFLEYYKPRKFELNNVKEISEKFKIKPEEKIKAMIQFPFVKNEYNNSFATLGRTKRNILFKGRGSEYKKQKKEREDYMNSNFLTNISKNQKYVYFPLHVEPEKVLHLGAPLYTDQIAIIRNIAKYLPIDYILYVKEHPGMENEGWRDPKYFEKIKEIQNVQLIHPKVTTQEIIENSSLVITIRGTSSLEAVFYEKPSIILAEDWGYSLIPSIHILKNLEELPQAIKDSLKKNVQLTELSDFINLVEQKSFEMEFIHFQYELAHRFSYNVGYLKQKKYDLEKLGKILEEFKNMFKKLGSRFEEQM